MGTIIVLLGKSRVRMMLWVPQGQTMDKCLVQDAGFIPLSLAPELGMFNPFTSAREALIPGQAHTEFQGVSAAVTFVGIINMTISPLTSCPHTVLTGLPLSVITSGFPNGRFFSQLQLHYVQRPHLPLL